MLRAGKITSPIPKHTDPALITIVTKCLLHVQVKSDGKMFYYKKIKLPWW